MELHTHGAIPSTSMSRGMLIEGGATGDVAVQYPRFVKIAYTLDITWLISASSRRVMTACLLMDRAASLL